MRNSDDQRGLREAVHCGCKVSLLYLEIIALNRTTLDGNPANKVVGTFTMAGNQSFGSNINEKATYEQILALKDKIFYRIVYLRSSGKIFKEYK